jgi:DNA-binding transcriptional ArsR family regulator
MTNISQQLKMLRLGGVVTKRRDKKQILYSIADDKIARLITFLRTEFLEDPTL